MLRFEIESQQIATRSGISSKTQKPYTIREQNALLFRDGEKYPERVKITLDDGTTPYPVGNYQLHDLSYSVNRYGALQVRPVLSPLAKAVAA